MSSVPIEPQMNSVSDVGDLASGGPRADEAASPAIAMPAHQRLNGFMRFTTRLTTGRNATKKTKYTHTNATLTTAM